MALTNCTITSASLTVTAGQDLGSTPDQVLVITPNTGYVVSAADFTNNSGSVNGITSITLTNSGSAYEASNKVLVTCNVDDNFSTSSNVTLTIDIDGEAKLAEALEYTIAGSLVQTICSTSLKENTTFNGSGAEGDTSLLFTKVVTVSNTLTHFFPTTPSIVLHSVGNYASNYTREAVNQVYTNGRLTSVTLKLYWTHPAENVAGHTITIDCPQVTIPTPKTLITDLFVDESAIDSKGGRRSITITGNSGATFSLTITRTSNSDTYDFTTNTFTSSSTVLTGTIPASGSVGAFVIIPTNSSGDTYNFSCVGTGSTTTSAGSTSDNTAFTASISQGTPISLVVNSTQENNPAFFSIASANNTCSLTSGGVYTTVNGEPQYPKALSIAISRVGGGNIKIRKQPEFIDLNGNAVDFTNIDSGSNGGTEWSISDLAATGDGTSTVTVAGSFYAIEAGTSSVTSVFNINNVVNTPPVASSITSQVSIANNTATTISLTAVDHDNDPLTYSVVSAPSKGSATINTLGVATYTPAGALSSGADSFTYKVNDGYQDSNTATVNVYIQGSGQGGSTYSTPQVRWYQMDTEASSPAYGLITNSSYQGTAAIGNFGNGSSSFNVQITDWTVTIGSGTMPSYVDNMGDITIKYVLKLVSNNSVVAGPTVMNKLSGNISGTNYSVGAMGATIGTSITQISVPGNINTSQEYRLEFMVEYDNIQQ
jgi:hypothetical protein